LELSVVPSRRHHVMLFAVRRDWRISRVEVKLDTRTIFSIVEWRSWRRRDLRTASFPEFRAGWILSPERGTMDTSEE